MEPQSARILVVDDEPGVRAVYRRVVLGRSCKTAQVEWLRGTPCEAFYSEHGATGPTMAAFCSDGEQAVETCRTAKEARKPFMVIFMDQYMPGRLQGTEAIQAIGSFDADAQVVLVSAYEGVLPRRPELLYPRDRLFFLQKPFRAEEIRQFAVALVSKWRNEQALIEYELKLEQLVLNRTMELERSRLDVVMRLAKAGEYRDGTTGHHIVRVGEYCRMLAEAHGLSDTQVRDIALAAMLHDIGKLGVPDKVLQKPGRLSNEEFGLMKMHCILGERILSHEPSGMDRILLSLKLYDLKPLPNPLLETAARIARSHHERWDGSGYPSGLRGEAIPLEARIVALADVYDALRSPRPYKPTLDHDTTLALMKKESHKYDPELFARFLRLAANFADVYEHYAPSEGH